MHVPLSRFSSHDIVDILVAVNAVSEEEMITCWKSSLGGGEGERLEDASGHGPDEGDGVGHHLVPVGLVPRVLAALLAVVETGVYPGKISS